MANPSLLSSRLDSESCYGHDHMPERLPSSLKEQNLGLPLCIFRTIHRGQGADRYLPAQPRATIGNRGNECVQKGTRIVSGCHGDFCDHSGGHPPLRCQERPGPAASGDRPERGRDRLQHLGQKRARVQHTYVNELLVMIDGRSVYNPAFGGVFRDLQDVRLGGMERIEVIRGPGAAIGAPTR